MINGREMAYGTFFVSTDKCCIRVIAPLSFRVQPLVPYKCEGGFG